MFKYQGIIALDLDGTLLNSNKELSNVNYETLKKAYEKGWAIVPTTGRFYDAMPEVIKQMPFIEYVIVINGAEVVDLNEHKTIYKAEIPHKQAIEIMTYLDQYPLIYDCFEGGAAFMTSAFKDKIDEMASNPHYRKMLRELRKDVDELKEYLKVAKKDVQKIQFFTNDSSLRLDLMQALPNKFDDLVISSSVIDNVEINHYKANKGDALLALADYLNVDKNKTIAFGDGLNDASMLKKAKLGIVMANASDEVKMLGDYITLSCDEDGVAKGIEKYILNREGNNYEL